jgi:uncharacterized membrane protein
VTRVLAAVLAAVAVSWATVIAAAPSALHSHTLAVPAAVVYAGAARICHQRPERSFHLAGTQLPVCARCAGLYFSAAAGALAGLVSGRRKGRASARTVLLIAAAPTALTWLLEHLAGVPMSNAVRALAALPLGAVAGWLFVQMLRYDSRLDGEQVLYS